MRSYNWRKVRFKYNDGIMKKLILMLVVLLSSFANAQVTEVYITNLTRGSEDLTHVISVASGSTCVPTFSSDYTRRSNAYTFIAAPENRFIIRGETEADDIVYTMSPQFESDLNTNVRASLNGAWYNTGTDAIIPEQSQWLGRHSNRINPSLRRLIRADGWIDHGSSATYRYTKNFVDDAGTPGVYQVLNLTGRWLLLEQLGNSCAGCGVPQFSEEFLSELMSCAVSQY